ncbi:hypothetical protein [Natronoglycomyces albus]|uniref:Tetratricopeptide repeat protein n=1 Tax=Natronoglycomyces albus TaxID=2811108 RepID=A0A895XQU2_9ACTN|nr:hypothetical protein [Natronoglycomyces albus]QSB03928.1 hypothetical protein JQS30_08825 [Natronoglycomyces albus]
MKNPDLSEGPIRKNESRQAPDMPRDVEFDYDDLDKDTKRQLRTLNKQLAELVGKRMLVTAALLEEDPKGALEHALYARSKASRVAAVREVAGVAAYNAGDWKLALAELKAAQRLSGTNDHVAMIADCERALGRPERAIDLFREFGNDKKIQLGDRVELLIVASGARRDMGMGEAATVMLQVELLNSTREEEWVARLRYAYAEALLADGREEEGRRWLKKAVAADMTGDVGASDRLLELEGVNLEEWDEADEDGADVSDEERDVRGDELDATDDRVVSEPAEPTLTESDETHVPESEEPATAPATTLTFAAPVQEEVEQEANGADAPSTEGNLSDDTVSAATNGPDSVVDTDSEADRDGVENTATDGDSDR